jgi:hypothetical protein
LTGRDSSCPAAEAEVAAATAIGARGGSEMTLMHVAVRLVLS